ncbi:MAG: hypothetical protein M1820_001608 [Bogoriella megaspora]|nr:MAG: hypothetical protein M1820_001608 [Bogoriella megaspora]
MGALGNLLPLIILFTIVGVAGFVGYHIYLVANDIGDKSRQRMEKKNINFSKDGMKVGVKELKNEEYADRTQNVLVKAWNSASIPNYKSRLGWNSTQARPENKRSHSSHAHGSSSPRPSTSRTTSSSSSKSPKVKSPGTEGLSARPQPVRAGSNPGAWPE